MNNSEKKPSDAWKWESKGYELGAHVRDLEIWAHEDAGYRKRTSANAECDVTMAVAADYSTGGERLTKQMAGARYIALPLYLDPPEAGVRLAQFMKDRSAKSLNIAGNGIYTMTEKGWSQEAVDQWIFNCVRTAHAIHPIWRIQSGGQTGADMSGAFAAKALGIPAKILFPKGFKQRGVDQSDFLNNPTELLAYIEARASELALGSTAADRAKNSTTSPSP